MKYDLLLEGAGVKGLAFVGAYSEFVKRGHTLGRLLASSGGALVAVMIAAGYEPIELLDAFEEHDQSGRSIIANFLAPPRFTVEEEGNYQYFRNLLSQVDTPYAPDTIEARLDDFILRDLASNTGFRHIFSLVERGSWYSADFLETWLKTKLNSGMYHDIPRDFSEMVLAEFFAATGVDITLLASDTITSQLLVLNHRMAPDCPLVKAVRMSMNLPILWPSVIWQSEWGTYRGRDITYHTIIDGTWLSNFPLELLISNEPLVTAVMGPSMSDGVLGFLTDESLPMPIEIPTVDSEHDLSLNLPENIGKLPIKDILHMVDLATSSNDKMVSDPFEDMVVRIPVGDMGTTDFDMYASRLTGLMAAGSSAVGSYFDTPAGVMLDGFTEDVDRVPIMTRMSNAQALNKASTQIEAVNALQDGTLPDTVQDLLRIALEALGFQVLSGKVKDLSSAGWQEKFYVYTVIEHNGRERILFHLEPSAVTGEITDIVAHKVSAIGYAFQSIANTLVLYSEGVNSLPASLNQIVTRQWLDRDRIVGKFIPWDSLARMRELPIEAQQHELLKGELRLEELRVNVERSVGLSPAQSRQFHSALKDAFPELAQLKMMVSFRLGVSLASIAGSGSLDVVAFDLIEWAQAKGRTADLIRAAIAENPGNSMLQAFAKEVLPDIE